MDYLRAGTIPSAWISRHQEVSVSRLLREVRSEKHRSRTVWGVAGVLVLALTVSVTLVATATAGRTSKAAGGGPYTFVLSNNFLGNDWRPQVEKLAQLTANLPPFKGNVKLK